MSILAIVRLGLAVLLGREEAGVEAATWRNTVFFFFGGRGGGAFSRRQMKVRFRGFRRKFPTQGAAASGRA